MKKTRSFLVVLFTVLTVGILTVSLAMAQGGGNSAVEFGAAAAAPASPSGGTLCTGSGGSVGIIHDDGTFENGYSGNPSTISTFEVLNLFNPVDPSYAYTRFCVALVSLGGPNLDFEIIFYDNDGPSNTPGTQLAAVPVSAVGIPGGLPCGWYEYDLTAVAGLPTGANGDIFIGVRYNPMTFPSRFTCADQSATTPLWPGYLQFNTGGWTPIQNSFATYRAMGLRVEMAFSGQPDIDANVSPDTQTVPFGGDATFTVAVTNTGNLTLTITVTDALVPDCDNSFDLGPDESYSYNCVDTQVTTSYSNTVVISSEFDGVPGPTITETVSVIVEPPTSVSLSSFDGQSTNLLPMLLGGLVMIILASSIILRRRQAA
ncbi:MAG: hypothetical protein KJ063_08590 [Anaerolineae bacterium]|nr:hypothetical protein [Anaerolineae bacterium]